MLPLKIAILWHFHQPYYLKDDEMFLPWVRLHGVKDYWDLPELFHEFPNIKQTINLVPSLTMQIEDYVSGKYSDKVQRLSKIEAHNLTAQDKSEVLKLFFLCNEENMIFPYERYNELYNRYRQNHDGIENFSEQDWLDIQVWYNLTWFGQFSRQRSFIKRLFDKGSGFTEEEKIIVLDLHLEVLNNIKQQMKMLCNLNQLEISCTPFYHPILPLLCDSKSALEAMPDAQLPETIFNHPEDALSQIDESLKYYKKYLGIKPNGMWPSEGSISNDVLNIMANLNVIWTSSDEEVLSASLKEKFVNAQKYFPYRFKTKSGEIAILFRDHSLSDAIGFLYSNWNPDDAAKDFCNRLQNIKSTLINTYGEDSLKYAVVPIILDGENCWEFYKDNGIHFQRAFYKQLSNSSGFQTVTCSEATIPENLNYMPELTSIRAGSWINADFKIWFGHPEHVAAWDMLAKAREEVEKAKSDKPSDVIKKAMEEIYIAEGSDWFWWYGDAHIAPNKSDFDVLFRWHIEQIYKILNLEVPENVYFKIGKYSQKASVIEQSGEVQPIIDGRLSTETEWDNAGYFDAQASMSAMHQIGELVKRLWYASDKNTVNFRIDTTRAVSEKDAIEIQFIEPAKFSILIKNNLLEINSDTDINIHKFNFAQKDVIEFSLSRNVFDGLKNDNILNIELTIRTFTNEGEIVYPRQGTLKIKI
ncbi:MAG: glycoside hydrolase family 57 protein [FCB group bacterium]